MYVCVFVGVLVCLFECLYCDCVWCCVFDCLYVCVRVRMCVLELFIYTVELLAVHVSVFLCIGVLVWLAGCLHLGFVRS